MKGVPKRTSDFLEKVVRGFPRTPYEGAKAIENYLIHNYRYGCDENILKNKWARFPNEINKFMTCQEQGIFDFFLTRALGFDSILMKLDNYNNTKQSHLSVLINDNQKQYMLSGNCLEIIHEVKQNSYDYNYNFESNDSSNKRTDTFSNLTLLDVPEVVSLIKYYKKEDAFIDFFRTGQFLSSYYVKSDAKIVKINRFITTDDNKVVLRKSYDFNGFFMNSYFDENTASFIFSSGLNNSVLENPIKLVEINQITKEAQFLEIDAEIKERIFDSYLRSHIASSVININTDKNKEYKKEWEDACINLYNKYQRPYAFQHIMESRAIQKITDEIFADYKKNSLRFEDDYLAVLSWSKKTTKVEEHSLGRKQHMKLLEMINFNAQKYGLASYNIK